MSDITDDVRVAGRPAVRAMIVQIRHEAVERRRKRKPAQDMKTLASAEPSLQVP